MILRPRVTLRQGTVLGTVLRTELPQPVEAFLGIPYALPPIGDRRFRPAEKVLPSEDVIDAARYGPAAPGKQLLPGSPALEYSEDCLTVNVFRQPAENSKQPAAEPLPVAVYLHGGAFNRGTASMHKTASMVSHSEEAFVAVTFNYRIGALGFLPSALSAKEGVLNLGLKDQILLLEWVQENVSSFGGDPTNVTLFGLSAGGHSIGHHLMHYKEGIAPLFQRVIVESGAPTSRAVRPYDAEVHEQQFRDFLKAVGCPLDTPEDQIFPFLRSLPSDVVTAAQTEVFDKYNPSLKWAFQPVIDGDIIARPPMDTWRKGLWHKVPIMTGFCRNEGSLYVDKAMSEPSQFASFFRDLLPLLSASDIDTIDSLYPDPSKYPDSPYREVREGVGSQYNRIEQAYAHYAYVAPVRQTAEEASNEIPVYLYQWALESSVIDGARHGDNMRYEVCDPLVSALSPAQKELAGTLHAYITSFITKGDPNVIAGKYTNRQKWLPYSKANPEAMVFGEDNKELVGGEVGAPTKFVQDTWCREECKFWWSKVDLSQQ